MADGQPATETVPEPPAHPTTIPWTRVVVEGGAIVVSILLAFAIDAAWDSRQERSEENDHLRALEAQFVGARALVQGEMEEMESAERATREILTLDPAQATGLGNDSLATFFVRSIRPGRANLPSGALDALLASGDLRLIGDRELASRLAAWPSLTAEAYENAGWLVEARDNELVPFLNLYVGGLWTANRSGLLADYPPTRYPIDTEGLFSDPRLEGILAARAVRLQLILDRYRSLAMEADSIIAMIRRRSAT